MLSRQEIQHLLPHSGTMFLLDEVVSWDAARIECRSRSHCVADHPLAHDGRIGVACGVEYCLQAMALHGALTASAPQPPGFLARIGAARFFVSYLDELGAELSAQATLIQALPRGLNYSFTLSGAGRLAIEGSATVALMS
jgi:predicted hotdog family 3-hydroxylacyl-ACP dehydratase